MGLCGSNEKSNKPGKTEGKFGGITPIVDVKEPIKEEEKNNDGNDKLKAAAPVKIANDTREKFNYKLIDSKTNKTYENEIDGDKTIEQLLTELKLTPDGDFTIEFKNNLTISQEQKDLKFYEVIKKIFNNEDNLKIIEMNYKYTGLDIPQSMNDIINEYIDSNKIIGTLVENDDIYSIITYEKDSGIIRPYHYKKSDNEDLINFNSFTAFCNAKGKLYFSGGEKDQTYDPDKSVLKFNDFFYIDLTSLDENQNKVILNNLPNLVETRTWHSMIFIPYKYIFIVGGSNTKSVEIYDIETNEIKKDKDLNEIRSECTLCLVNNKYLYAFCGFILHQEFNSTIERCNLLKEERNWEYVVINDKDGLNFKPSFFGVCNFKNNNELLLIGCNDNGDENHSDYIYKIGNNENDEREEYQCNLSEKNSIFKEKFFLPISNEKSVTIPLPIGNDYKILIFDSNNGEISTQNYEEIFQ